MQLHSMSQPSSRKPSPDSLLSLRGWLGLAVGRMRYAIQRSAPRYLLEMEMQFPEIPGARVRQYREGGFAACRQLYELNAPGRLPACGGWDLATYLRTVPQRFLVLEVGAEVVACGGYKLIWSDWAHFFQGLVHPRCY